MQQLTALDSAFLSMETDEIPCHISGLVTVNPGTHPEKGFHFDSFVDFVNERLALCPRFRWRLQEVPFGLDAPYWIEDRFDVTHHVRRIALPAPGGAAELAQLTSFLLERPLDRSRPLWEIFYIEGLQGERVGLLWKIHHCLMDGISGASLIEALFDLAPDSPERRIAVPDEAARASRSVTLPTIAWRGARNALRRPSAMLRHLSQTSGELVGRLRDGGLPSMTRVPRTPFNGAIGARRQIAWARISLDRVKGVKKLLGVSVNDVVLALTGESVRRYLQEREALPSDSLVVTIPVSRRDEGDRSMGNQVSAIAVAWGTDIADPVERVQRIHESTREAKESGRARRLNPMDAAAESLLPLTLNLLVRAANAGSEYLPPISNAVVSNVPMTPVPLYVAGAKIESLVPLSLLVPTQGLNVTVLSYCGELFFGIIGDPDRVDSVWAIADAIPKALADLEAALATRMHEVRGEPNAAAASAAG